MASNKYLQMQKYLDLAESINYLFPQFQTSAAELGNLPANKKIEFFRVLLEEFHVNIEAVLKTILEKHVYPAAYQNIMYICVIYAYTVALFEALSGQRLPLVDFLKSGSCRIANRIKVMVNFYCYVNNSYYHKLQPVYDNILSDYNFLHNMHKSLDVIKEASNKTAIEIFSYEECLVKQKEEMEQLILKCTERLNAEGKLVEENKKRKEDLVNLEKKKTLTSETLANELDREKKLRKLIVNDYDTLVVKRDKLKSELTELTSVNNDYLQNIQVKVECAATYSRAIESVNKLTETDPLSAVLNKYNTISSIHSQINKSLEDCNNLISLRDEIQHEEQGLNTGNLKLDEELHSWKLKKDASRTSLMGEIQELTKEYDDIVNKKKKYMNLAVEFGKQIEYARKCCLQHEANSKVLFEFYQKQYKKILEAKGELDGKVDTSLRELKKKSRNIDLTFAEE